MRRKEEGRREGKLEEDEYEDEEKEAYRKGKEGWSATRMITIDF